MSHFYSPELRAFEDAGIAFEIRVSSGNRPEEKQIAATVDILFHKGPLSGLKFEGFRIYENGNVAFPSRQFNGADWPYIRGISSRDQTRPLRLAIAQALERFRAEVVARR